MNTIVQVIHDIKTCPRASPMATWHPGKNQVKQDSFLKKNYGQLGQTAWH